MANYVYHRVDYYIFKVAAVRRLAFQLYGGPVGHERRVALLEQRAAERAATKERNAAARAAAAAESQTTGGAQPEVQIVIVP